MSFRVCPDNRSDHGRVVVGVALLLCVSSVASAEQVKIQHPPGDQRIYDVEISVVTEGKVATTKSAQEKDELPMRANASFQFHERKLPAAGRDAEALRAVRDIAQAGLKTTVSDFSTEITLPRDRRLIVANGTREGAVCYSPDGILTREAADLLEIPGDPLALVALLPSTPVETAEEWTPPDWALQMLTGIEAVEKTQCKCRLDQMTPHAAKITFAGKVEGIKLGAQTTVEVAGAMIFDRENEYLSQAKTVYRAQASVGVVNPGLSMTVTSVLSRKPVSTKTALDSIDPSDFPFDAPEELLALEFKAREWGIGLRHSRDWHLFHAVYEGNAPVAILRFMNLGSLVAQCNVSPIANAAPGETIPLEQFESDIKQSLGKRFGEIMDREKIPTSGNRQIFRVVVSGEVEVGGSKGTAQIPMNWIYYLVAGPNGQQASFVFSVEPSLMEQLGTEDRKIVESLQFSPTSTAARR